MTDDRIEIHQMGLFRHRKSRGNDENPIPNRFVHKQIDDLPTIDHDNEYAVTPHPLNGKFGQKIGSVTIKPQIGSTRSIGSKKGIDRLDVMLVEKRHDGEISFAPVQESDRHREFFTILRAALAVDTNRKDILLFVGGACLHRMQ